MTTFKTGLSIGEIISQFAAEYDAKPNTIALYVKLIERFFRFLVVRGYDNRGPSEKHILFFKKYLADETENAAAYINLNLAALKSFFKWMEQKGFHPNIGQAVKSYRLSEDFKKVPLFAEDVKKLLAVIPRSKAEGGDLVPDLPGLRDRAIILLLFENGLRLSEALSIRVKDFRGNVVSILGKARHDREVVRITDNVKGAIQQYMINTEHLREHPLYVNENDPRPLFLSHSHSVIMEKGISRQDATAAINKRLEKAGLKRVGVSPHSLRHGSACELVLQGASLYEVSIHLRHRSLNISRVYTRLAEQKLMNKNAPEQKLSSLLE